MLRGINKQIIEVKCTNNEYFEKILLFVKGEKSDLPSEILRGQAMNCCSVFTSVYPKRKRWNYTKTAAVVVLLCLLGLAVGITAAALLL
ncbi:hypothetical protein [Ruminococcus sp. Marseille-P6503]|uniref:hypothetical protein n=1 Tax=Ruminococcus sp. Marseille-P6503 TaxID=2364796 RepID=UPI000F52CDCA|nr:hypothetical protein [Ruminococcus sp. Marseille-P6503]